MSSATSTQTRKHLLLTPADVPASRDDLEVIGVFNPGAIEVDGEVVLLVRVVERSKELVPDYIGLPRWETNGNIVVDRYPMSDIETKDCRVVHVRSTGRARLTFESHLRVVSCGDGLEVRRVEPTIFRPHSATEEYGVEDPRITQLDGRCWFTYVAVSRHGVATALASTTNFREFTRHGIIFPPENKDVVLFPEKINGKYCALHRPTSATPFTAPEMWVSWSEDLEHWGHHTPLVLAEGREWSSARVGAGTPPIRVDDGWLVLYHGSRRSTKPGRVGEYVAAAVVLDANEPSRIIAESAEAIFAPTEPYETEGFVPDVVFPTGTVRRGDSLLVYYGAGDTNVAVIEMNIDDIRRSLVAPS